MEDECLKVTVTISDNWQDETVLQLCLGTLTCELIEITVKEYVFY